ncbi:membrane lipoprotein lipid attachment site-containing protein [Lagierella massiliensis]|uniref:membrane lipoprotein lipid attachment site-containing protein n=1 Tax=Lagierella massiliensis TaxID=1689303 RepID=UPI0006D8002A|nr:membrane lipoprotein lipid attachment site-containing protein [Lagierella massiliensis]
MKKIIIFICTALLLSGCTKKSNLELFGSRFDEIKESDANYAEVKEEIENRYIDISVSNRERDDIAVEKLKAFDFLSKEDSPKMFKNEKGSIVVLDAKDKLVFYHKGNGDADLKLKDIMDSNFLEEGYDKVNEIKNDNCNRVLLTGSNKTITNYLDSYEFIFDGENVTDIVKRREGVLKEEPKVLSLDDVLDNLFKELGQSDYSDIKPEDIDKGNCELLVTNMLYESLKVNGEEIITMGTPSEDLKSEFGNLFYRIPTKDNEKVFYIDPFSGKWIASFDKGMLDN